MRKLFLLLIAIGITGFLNALQQLKENQQAVQHRVIGMFDALSNRDSVSLKNYCT